MKTFARARRLSLSTVFLISITVAIVLAKETHQKDSLKTADVVDAYAVTKETRRWGLCYGGKCGRRRSRNRGMKMVRRRTFRFIRKNCIF